MEDALKQLIKIQKLQFEIDNLIRKQSRHKTETRSTGQKIFNLQIEKDKLIRSYKSKLNFDK